MKNRGYQQLPPMIDPSELSEGEQIRIKYDRHGNPVRIWKERRFESCTFWLFAFALAALAALWWYFFRQPKLP